MCRIEHGRGGALILRRTIQALLVLARSSRNFAFKNCPVPHENLAIFVANSLLRKQMGGCCAGHCAAVTVSLSPIGTYGGTAGQLDEREGLILRA